MFDVIPNERRNVRNHIDGVGMFTKGNARKFDADLQGYGRIAAHRCRSCGDEVESADTRHYRRGIWCAECTDKRSSGAQSVDRRVMTDVERVANYVDVMRRMEPRRWARFLEHMPKKYRAAVLESARMS